MRKKHEQATYTLRESTMAGWEVPNAWRFWKANHVYIGRFSVSMWINIPGLTQIKSWPCFGGKAGHTLNMVACHDLLCALQRLQFYLGHPVASIISSAWAAFWRIAMENPL